MPFALLALCLTVALAVHAAKTGRFSPWGWIIVMLPPLGGVAYVLVELLPELLGSPHGQKAQREVARRANPEKTYRILRDRLLDAGTVANWVRLAKEYTAQVAGGLRAVRTRSFAGPTATSRPSTSAGPRPIWSSVAPPTR